MSLLQRRALPQSAGPRPNGRPHHRVVRSLLDAGADASKSHPSQEVEVGSKPGGVASTDLAPEKADQVRLGQTGRTASAGEKRQAGHSKDQGLPPSYQGGYLYPLRG